MTRVLFVTNGHGEIAIADRIAAELALLAPQIETEHLALVGDVTTQNMRDVGPRRRMPSGGIVAMGNLRNIARDVFGGLLQLTLSQISSLRKARRRYAAVVAVGDVYALTMALIARSPVIYVGTAKSVLVAPYGSVERAILRRARARFVRDAATAASLERNGVTAEAAGNVIVDLYAHGDPAEVAAAARGFERVVALLPGSRDTAYADAAFLLDVLARTVHARPDTGGVLSIAPGLDVAEMVRALGEDYQVELLDDPQVPFAVHDGERVVLRAWTGTIGPLLQRSLAALGQAGTANEAAAAAGLPVLAVVQGSGRAHGWYRYRQTKLLGEALVALAPDAAQAARQLGELIDDPGQRRRRGDVGRARMGPPGGARRIGERVAEIALAQAENA